MKALESESARLFRLLAEWRRLSPESMLLSHSCQMGRQQTQLKQTNKSNKCKTMEEAILQLVIFVVVEEFHSHPLPAALPRFLLVGTDRLGIRIPLIGRGLTRPDAGYGQVGRAFSIFHFLSWFGRMVAIRLFFLLLICCDTADVGLAQQWCVIAKLPDYRLCWYWIIGAAFGPWGAGVVILAEGSPRFRRWIDSPRRLLAFPADVFVKFLFSFLRANLARLLDNWFRLWSIPSPSVSLIFCRWCRYWNGPLLQMPWYLGIPWQESQPRATGVGFKSITSQWHCVTRLLIDA